MAKREVKKTKTADTRGNIPTGKTEMRVTMNMGDYNSLSVETGIYGIDISSPEATKRELETGKVCMRMVVEFTDELTGTVVSHALGDEAAGEFQANFLRALAEVQAQNGKGGKK